MSESEARYQRWWGGGLIGYRAWPLLSTRQRPTEEALPPPAEAVGGPWSRWARHRTDGETPPLLPDAGSWPDERWAQRHGRWCVALDAAPHSAERQDRPTSSTGRSASYWSK